MTHGHLQDNGQNLRLMQVLDCYFFYTSASKSNRVELLIGKDTSSNVLFLISMGV